MAESRLAELRREPRHHEATDDDHNHIGGLLELIWYAQPQSVIEIGAHVGVSTEAFALTCNHVATVDPWAETHLHYLAEFNARINKYDNVHAIRGRSPQALERFVDHSFDMCYIDGAHAYDNVCADIKGCDRLIKPGGWYAGHDWHLGEIVKAVRDCLSATCTRVQVFRDNSWLVKKPFTPPMRFQKVL